jgi:putative transposase
MPSFSASGLDTTLNTNLTSWDWPHAPAHRLGEKGAYMVTAGTYEKRHFLNSPDRFDLVLSLLFRCATEFDWQLQAWAVMTNHYHFVALSPDNPKNLGLMLGKLHGAIARELNAEDGTAGRKVFHQYWDTHITFQRSYLARLKYVHQNPVHHGIVRKASEYRWCSAAWFERSARPAFVKSVYRFKTDRINVQDDF